MRKIREAINRASSLEEVERLQKILQSGQIPGHEFKSSKFINNKVIVKLIEVIPGHQNGTAMDYE